MDRFARSIATHFKPPPLPLTRFAHSRNVLRQTLASSGKAFATASVIGLASGGLRTVALSGGVAPKVNAANSRGGGGQTNVGEYKFTITHGLIALNVLLFGAQWFTKEALTVWGVKINSLIMAGQYWRLMTPAFLHGNLMHLFVNCLSLNNLGPSVENLSGGKRLLAVYLLAAFTGNVASFFGSQAPSLGASGAVFGVGGALAMYFYQNKELYGKHADKVLNSLWQTLLVNIIYGLSNPRIDNWGHLGGLAGGALAAYLLGPTYKIGSIEGQRGSYLVDAPPIRLLASPPRQIKR